MNYKVTLTTLTPLHIGTGQKLLAGYDFVSDDRQNITYRLKVDTILDHALGQETHLNEQILRSKPAQLVKLEELRPAESTFVAYRLKGLPQSAEVNEQVKDVWGRLYLPGSSLKGALRTVIGRHLVGADEKLKAMLQIPAEARAKFADDELDKVIFGSSPNRDILRALQVADSLPVMDNPQLSNVKIVKGNQLQSPVDVEAIPAETTFETTLHLEEYLFRELRKVARLERQGAVEWVNPARRLGWRPEKIEWMGDLLTALPIFGRNLAQQRFRREIAYFKKVGLAHLANLYESWQKQLQDMRGQNAFFLQIGWAGGWESKTLGRDLLAKDDSDFAALRTRFALGRPPDFKGRWEAKPGQAFPVSRRLVMDGGRPVAPLGWVRVELGGK